MIDQPIAVGIECRLAGFSELLPLFGQAGEAPRVEAECRGGAGHGVSPLVRLAGDKAPQAPSKPQGAGRRQIAPGSPPSRHCRLPAFGN